MSEGAPRLLDALHARAREVVDRLHADACLISRALGDVLVIVTQHTTDGTSLDLGQGFLVSDYPATQHVLASGEPCRLTLDDEDVDPAEARLLRELGYASLLMLRFDVRGERWGLVEVYRRDARRFDDGDLALARGLTTLA